MITCLSSRKHCTVLLLMYFGILGFVPVGYGQSDPVSFQISQLKDTDSVVRWRAADALGAIKDPRAVEPLVAALKDADRDVRLSAAAALGAIKDPRAVAPLSVALKDPDDRVRYYAAEALGKIKDPRAIMPLLAIIQDPDSLQNSDNGFVLECAATALGEIGTPAIAPLIAILNNPNDLVQHRTTMALGKIGTPAVAPLVAALKAPNGRVRASAAEALGNIKDPRTVMPLIAALKDTNHDVQMNAAKALGEIQDPRAVPPLIAALKNPDSGVRGYAAWALVTINDPRMVAPLIAAVKDPDSYVRQLAVDTLGELRDPRAVLPLIAALKDKERFVKMSAASGLGRIKDLRAVAPLVVALKDPDEDDEMQNSVPLSAAMALGNFGEPGVKALIAALKTGDDRVRDCAATGLELIGTPAVAPLITVLQDPIYNLHMYDVQMSAAWALRKSQDPRAVSALLALTKAMSSARSNYKSLIAQGKPGSEPELIGALFKSGDKTMAEVFLNCRNPKLKAAAKAWAIKHSVQITQLASSEQIWWGSGQQIH
jgi:HEAT repeat protein